MTFARPHSFHIPVMGTGFTIDTPLRVARYGISSVISLVDDVLIERIRRHHAELAGEPYTEIRSTDEDARARRITAYLDLLDVLIQRQMCELKAAPFEPGSEITRYFELLPDSPLRSLYQQMIETPEGEAKARLQQQLRDAVVSGSIDVNIMTKLDCLHRGPDGQPLPQKTSDAMSALRGFALSTTRSSIVFSAGLNTHLYSYAGEFPGFLPDASGQLHKKITLKVSDYRSAEIQGKFLAKRGLWVSEFRVESGLNCGGHAFASNGRLLGPILQEFMEKRGELVAELHRLYLQSAPIRKLGWDAAPHQTLITVQGGIGTAEENELCLRRYKVDGTGWGTPFLFVPEVTNVDAEHLEKLCAATEDDVFLSDSSPLGVPFWNLRNSGSEEKRRERIEEGNPGSPCPKGYLLFNTELTERPVCVAARAYVRKKLDQLKASHLSEDLVRRLRESVLAKSCICHDLAGGVSLKLGFDENASPAICPGKNAVDFSSLATLEEMVGHIYGRLALLKNVNRHHMFLRELMLNIEYLSKEWDHFTAELSNRTPKYFLEFRDNLLSGIEHYQHLAEEFLSDKKSRFLAELKALQEELECLPLFTAPSSTSAS
jgi:hypothetical protein